MIFNWIAENVNYTLLSLCRLLDFVLEHTLCISTEVLFFQDFHSSFVMTSLRSFYSEYNLVSLLRPEPSSNSVFLILKGLTSSVGRSVLLFPCVSSRNYTTSCFTVIVSVIRASPHAWAALGQDCKETPVTSFPLWCIALPILTAKFLLP